MAGKNQAVVRQTEDLLGDGAVECAGVALLEIAAAGAADQQTVAGERHAVVVGHISNASIGVAGRRAHFQIAFPEGHPVAMIEAQVRPLDGAVQRFEMPIRQPVACCINHAPVTWSA